MKKCKYPHLFTPIVLGGTFFRNRIFASPTGYQNVNGDGYLNEGAVAYYERKAMGGAAGAALAKRCGFGMVTVHAGHGWLLHQFLSPVTNTRKDKWGGPDIKNRTRLVKKILKAIRKVVGKNFPIEIRLSGSECYPGGYGIDEGIAIARELEEYVDLIHVSAGHHEREEVFVITHPGMFQEEGCNVKYAAAIKKHVKTPVAAIGGLSDPELMEEIIASGQADVVELARALIADPDLPNKIRSGHEEKARRCLRCLACFSNEMIYGQPYCAINPESGRELDMKYAPLPSVKKKVLVVGGGIGGMQAALTCAQRGHEVILCEKSSRLGGVLLCEEDVDFKKNLLYYLKQQEKALKDAGVEIRLNTEVTPAYASQIQADVIIAALGARPAVPPIPGIDAANVMPAQAAYRQVEKIGSNVIILGAGLVGIELGLHLRQKGKNVKILELTDHISDGGNFLHVLGLKVEIKKRGLEILFHTKVKEIRPDCVLCDTPDGEKKYRADTVIYATGQVPLREEAAALNFCAPEFYMLGDCVTPRNITSATAEAYLIARNIGRRWH